jgi:predicted protein tyrosine phosphatase
MQVKLDQIRHSFGFLFRNEDRAQGHFRLMPGWDTLAYMICSDITKAAVRAGVSKGALKEYPSISRIDEENGYLVFEIETDNPALKLVVQRNIINPAVVMSTKTCMVCSANCEHVATGIERLLCLLCERNYQRRQYSRLDGVEFIGRTEAESRKPMKNVAVISITQFGDEPAKLKNGWHSILRMEFDDVDPNKRNHNMPHDHEDLLDIDRAQAIVHFVDGVASQTDGIIVHCKAGISRSVAVAKWISEAYGLDFDEDYTDYNEYVLSLLTKAAAR